MGGKYVVYVNIVNGLVDTVTPINGTLGPSGENLVTAGWTFSAPSNSTLSFTRPVANQATPISYLAGAALNTASNLVQLRVASAATAGGTAFSVNQTYSGGSYTGGTIFSINNAQFGFGTSTMTLHLVFTI
jgi:hypothetical protein